MWDGHRGWMCWRGTLWEGFGSIIVRAYLSYPPWAAQSTCSQLKYQNFAPQISYQMSTNQLQILPVDRYNMEMEDLNSHAIGLHTNINETSALSQEKLSLENGCSIAYTEITQASRTLSNHFTTPDKKNEEYAKKRRFFNNNSYKRKIQLREMRDEKPMALPHITKRIKKRLDLRKTKSDVFPNKKSEVKLLDSSANKVFGVGLLTLAEKATLYDWLLQSAEGLKLSRSVFHLAITTLEKVSFFSRDNAQLVATTCLYTQAVLDERCPRPIEQFEEITQGFVSTFAIRDYQVRIMKDQDWILPRISLLEDVFEILENWDAFVLEKPKFIVPEKAEKCMFMRGRFHVQNFVQLMAIVDSLRVLSLVSEKNISMVLFSLLTTFVGLELGYSTLETLPGVTVANYLPYQIVKFFVAQRYRQKSISPNVIETQLKKIYRVVCAVMGILIPNKSNVAEEVEAVKSKEKTKLDFHRQFYFEGINLL